MVSNPSRIKLQRRRPPNSNWLPSKPWNAVLQTDRCAEGKQLKRKPTLDLLITKSKPQFPLRGKFWHSSPEAKVSYTQNWGSNTTIEAKANIGLVALRPLQQHPASTAQKIIPWWRTFFVFLLKSPVTTNSNDSHFCAAHSSLVTCWTTSDATQRPHFWLLNHSGGRCALGSMWSHSCQKAKPEAFLPQGQTMAWNPVALH